MRLIQRSDLMDTHTPIRSGPRLREEAKDPTESRQRASRGQDQRRKMARIAVSRRLSSSEVTRGK
jgi:hypothetical protein